MLRRTSHVQSIHVDIVSFASIIQVGDSSKIYSFSRALAVQRESEIFFGNEGNYNVYPIFSEPIPLPVIDEDVNYIQHHLNPLIKVNKIMIAGISSSSSLHVGSSQNVSLETRIEHVRQLLPRDGEQIPNE